MVKLVNLEQGMPYADQAIRRLTFEINDAKRRGYSTLKLIHGYGSSGKGGVLRVEIRNYLLRIHSRNDIQAFIPGEDFSIFDNDTRIAFGIEPELRKDRDLDMHNNGVTFVIL